MPFAPKTAAKAAGPRRTDDGRFILRYNMAADWPAPDWWADLMAWATRAPTGLDHVEHLRRYFAAVHPDSAWHSWRESRFRSLTDSDYATVDGATTIRNISWIGCAASGKTADSGDFAFAWWFAEPSTSTVILTSTSKQKMKQRVWPQIQSRYVEAKQAMDACGLTGPHMLNSTLELQAQKGDSKHAIFAQAVEPGELSQAVERLKGVHCPRIMLIIDEAPGTPEAILATVPNMQKGCEELIVLTSGNGPFTHLDPFSKICRPVRGWSSISHERDHWDTVAVPEYQLPSGHCLHFSGRTSPNVLAGRTIFPFLYSHENWQRVVNDPIYQRTAACYNQDYGFWVPEGFCNTVLTEEQIERGDARGTRLFVGATTPMGSLDPAFGGDQCKLRFGRRGRLEDGHLAVQLDESFDVPILVDLVDGAGKPVPIEYQIVNYILPLARSRGVHPEDFGVESTGTGRGVAAILTQDWGEIVAVESGGRPSDLPASEEDPRPSREVYDRRITELYFAVQTFVNGRQLGGLTEADTIQFCSRQFVHESKKYKVETKADLKERLGRSPDDADSVAVFVEVARRHGLATRGPRAERMHSQHDRLIRLQTRLLDEHSLYQPEPAPFDADAPPA